MKEDDIIEEIYAISAFLVGYGDVCEIAARKLRELAKRIEGDIEE